MNNDYCVCCGNEVAEASQVCKSCNAELLADRLWEAVLMEFLKK